MRPLRILLVHERFPPDYGGGGEYVVLETARHLKLRAHDVRVLAAGDPAIREYEGIPTTRLPMARYAMNLAWRRVADEAADADLIHAFTYHAAYPAYRAGRALGKPVVCGVLALFGEVWREMRGPLAGRAFQRIERFLLDLPVQARVFLSEDSRRLAPPANGGRVRDVVNEPGISLDDYRPAADASGVLFAGKLDTRKGIDTVLRVAACLPHVPFRIVGWGPRFDEIASVRPSNVVLERFRDRAHVAEALAHASIFLFPTKAETFGLVVAEAMASGCAVVSTSSLPFEGARLRDGDPESAAAAVAALWEAPARCREQGARNRELALRYSWPAHVERLEALYREVLAPADGAAS